MKFSVRERAWWNRHVGVFHVTIVLVFVKGDNPFPKVGGTVSGFPGVENVATSHLQVSSYTKYSRRDAGAFSTQGWGANVSQGHHGWPQTRKFWAFKTTETTISGWYVWLSLLLNKAIEAIKRQTWLTNCCYYVVLTFEPCNCSRQLKIFLKIHLTKWRGHVAAKNWKITWCYLHRSAMHSWVQIFGSTIHSNMKVYYPSKIKHINYVVYTLYIIHTSKALSRRIEKAKCNAKTFVSFN
jgi:hypothetical protein